MCSYSTSLLLDLLSDALRAHLACRETSDFMHSILRKHVNGYIVMVCFVLFALFCSNSNL